MSVSASALSVSPPRFVLEVLPESVLAKTVVINVPEIESGIISVLIEGDAANWIEHPSQLILPVDTDEIESTFNIAVPSSTPLGNYSASIHYFLPTEGNVHLAFSIPIEFIVTNVPRLDYALRDLDVKQEKNLSLLFTVYNRGSADFGPTEAVIRIMDNLQTNTLYEGSQTIDRIGAFTTESAELDFGTSLPKGNYWVVFSIPSYGYKETVFLEARQIAALEATDTIVDKETVLPTLFITGSVVVLLFTIGFIIRRKLRR